MKIEFNENEKYQIEYFNNESNKDRLMMNPENKDEEYSLSFKVTDVGKANLLIHTLLFNKNRIEGDDIGIEVTSLGYYGSRDDERRNLLQELNDVVHKYLN